MVAYQESPLWQQAFGPKNDGLDQQRQRLSIAYEKFRERVSHLIDQIRQDMPALTVHDITHVDALWWTASEIAGETYPLNPSEAFVLGGTFLLHDAAHCMAAYPGGVEEIQALTEWKEFATRSGVPPEALVPRSAAHQLILFEVLRVMHPKQARRLAWLSWSPPGDETPLYLLPDDELRAAYAKAIGKISESHWWSPHELEELSRDRINPPVCLGVVPWCVDPLKVAVLLRTADAAHIDEQRAPRFLMALVQPGGSSLAHWQFQSRLQKAKRDPDTARHELCISGSPFPPTEQDAWWMAYDTARMIDNELRAGNRLLLDHHREQLAARSVAACYSPEAFSRNVPVEGWQPVDTSIRITDIKTMVERFGGEKLYGSDPAVALRELLQNAVDAIHARRKLGGLDDDEGSIEVSVEDAGDERWLHVTDTGVGMSRYVLTEVLLDFGRSLWRSAELRGEWSGLTASGFEAIGQFGIGFFSVFMLGERVRVTTHRYEPKEGENNQWLLEFSAGPHQRPILRKPTDNERLRRHGTRVSVLVSAKKFEGLCPKLFTWASDSPRLTILHTCARLAPAIDIDLWVKEGEKRVCAVKANDWKTLPPIELLQRIAPAHYLHAESGHFGHWTHLCNVRGLSQEIGGRCAISATHYYLADTGVGVIKGLFAGKVAGIAGVVFVQQQDDLARKTALPALSVAEVQAWANEQKKLLVRRDKLEQDDSALLALFGAEHSGLVLGKLGGLQATYEDVIARASQKITLLVHDGEVSHDDDDDVLKRDFESGFEAEENLLEMPSARPPAWLTQLTNNSDSHNSWSLEAALLSALHSAWGESNWDASQKIVGSVDGHDITRECRVFAKSIDAFDL